MAPRASIAEIVRDYLWLCKGRKVAEFGVQLEQYAIRLHRFEQDIEKYKYQLDEYHRLLCRAEEISNQQLRAIEAQSKEAMP